VAPDLENHRPIAPKPAAEGAVPGVRRSSAPSRASHGGALLPAGSIVLVVACGLALLVWFQFGSFRAALGLVRGQALLIDPNSVTIHSARAGTTHFVSFAVRNLKSVPVTIVGYRATCNCSGISGLPLEIPPGETIELTVAITPRDKLTGKSLATRLLLYLDVECPPTYLDVSIDNILPNARDS
jgi:hypothetical protein